MKKTIILALCLIGTAATASAQFKIHSNGNMSFKRTATTQPSSPISLASGSNSNYFVTYSGEWNGIYCNVTDYAPTISGKNFGK